MKKKTISTFNKNMLFYVSTLFHRVHNQTTQKRVKYYVGTTISKL